MKYSDMNKQDIHIYIANMSGSRDFYGTRTVQSVPQKDEHIVLPMNNAIYNYIVQAVHHVYTQSEPEIHVTLRKKPNAVYDNTYD